MKRINMGNGRWFDEDTAKRFEEDTRWDGNNHISVATGAQFEHERLYLTASENWIKHCWSQWQGSGSAYDVIEEEEAHTWLLNNGHDVPDHALQAREM